MVNNRVVSCYGSVFPRFWANRAGRVLNSKVLQLSQNSWSTLHIHVIAFFPFTHELKMRSWAGDMGWPVCPLILLYLAALAHSHVHGLSRNFGYAINMFIFRFGFRTTHGRLLSATNASWRTDVPSSLLPGACITGECRRNTGKTPLSRCAQLVWMLWLRKWQPVCWVTGWRWRAFLVRSKAPSKEKNRDECFVRYGSTYCKFRFINRRRDNCDDDDTPQ